MPEEMPGKTMHRIFLQCDQDTGKTDGFSHASIRDYLSAHQRQGERRNWDVFREKIPEALLRAWGGVMVECRRNGFVGPRVDGDRIVFQQVISTNDRPGDLCTLCDRDCKRREQIDSGETRVIKEMNRNNSHWVEPRPCWEN